MMPRGSHVVTKRIYEVRPMLNEKNENWIRPAQIDYVLSPGGAMRPVRYMNWDIILNWDFLSI